MKRESGAHGRPREARLRAASAHVYPGITPDVWIQAATMADIVWARRLQRGEGYTGLHSRVLDPEHFEFRCGGAPAAEAPPPRHRATDPLRTAGD
jgi:hypothetical protein